MFATLAQPAVYWFLVAASLLLLAAIAVVPLAPARYGLRPLRGDRTFLAVAGLAFVAMRWPTVFGSNLYIDEAQMIAQAVTAQRHPVPWRSFDGTTSGPLNTYALLLPRLFGIGVSLFGARLVASALTLIALGALFFAVRAIYGGALARAAAIPPLVLFGLAENQDFTAYSSEIFPIALLTVALAIAAVTARAARANIGLAVLAGACCGAVPFAKLQGSVLAAATALVCIVALTYRAGNRRSATRLGAAFVASALAPGAVILGVVAAGGALGDFAIRYVFQNLSSMVGKSATLHTAFAFPEYRIYFTQTFWLIVAAPAAWLVTGRSRGGPPREDVLPRAGAFVALGLLLLSGYTIEAPHREYPHYFLFAVIPVVCFAVAFAGATRFHATTAGRRAIGALLALYVVAFSVPMYTFATEGRGAYLATVPGGIANAPDAVAQRIAALDPPGGRVAIWGYAPYLYVKSGTMLGTRDSLAQFSLNGNPFRAYYRSRFLFDMEQNEPALFVDACAPGQFDFADRASFGFETFPELAAYIKDHYIAVAEVNGVRIYRSLSRRTVL